MTFLGNKGEIMADVYKRLAQKLDEMPNGYPATESGIELKILRKIFTPEEAGMALQIKPIPETVETIASRLGKTVPEMQPVLDAMVEKGHIGTFKLFGQQMYMFFPFVIGIYEFQVNRLDKELSAMFEEYLPQLSKTLGGYAPAVMRVVPVSTEIKADLLVHRYEDIRRLIDESKSFQVADCICRKEREAEGHPCSHTKEICLGMSPEEGAYDKFAFGRIISKEEALRLLEKAEQEGLVHCTYNVAEGNPWICNCCACCCGILRGVKEYDAPHMLVRSNFMAAIDTENCVACGVCADERCPMDAIVEEGGVYRVLAERCIGCGVCTPTCPTDSIKLISRPEAERDIPPSDPIDWNVKRAVNRGIEIKMG
jgi:Na+-translocating ferredoxin:NAD+ oxidoreductase subunit B